MSFSLAQAYASEWRTWFLEDVETLTLIQRLDGVGATFAFGDGLTMSAYRDELRDEPLLTIKTETHVLAEGVVSDSDPQGSVAYTIMLAAYELLLRDSSD